jgi:hypothetical protein
MNRIHVHDSWQPDYSYELVAPEGRQFDPEFTPDLSPQQMLELGVFGGHYFQGEHDEFPKEWFAHARLSDVHDPLMNFFEVDASQPLRVWQQKGWIALEDPRGWFQWYCRYYLGRRLGDEDQRQIKRWKAIRRHIAQVHKACHPGDLTCRRRQRQALLHWAYDSRKI